MYFFPRCEVGINMYFLKKIGSIAARRNEEAQKTEIILNSADYIYLVKLLCKY